MEVKEKLTSKAVTRLARYCLYREAEGKSGEIPEGAIVVDGLVRRFAFHPERLQEKKSEINDLLRQLPAQFHRSTGGGWSFLMAPQAQDGCGIWGQQTDAEALICLGIGVGSASWLLRDMADALPGGVPYVEVHVDA